MQRLAGNRLVGPRAESQAARGSWRDRLAMLLALVTAVCVGWAFLLSKDTRFLMPGPLASPHAAIESCSACHANSGNGKLSWIHGLVTSDPLADSKACLTCHKMPDTAFNAHGASAEMLDQSTRRLTKIAAKTPAPRSARMQSVAFPTDGMVARGLECATCHQEHQGINSNLDKISNEQCRSCHVVKFDSFDGRHPKFENYPFKRRTRIIYDHAGHFGNHFVEASKKDPARRVPATCSTCHNSGEDRRLMAVAPFEQTCSACHLDQIIGRERVSGPKGIAFLSLPGLDLQTLRKRRAAIGEWPDSSEAPLTPFMKVMISRNQRGRSLIKAVDGLNLQDLSRANEAQIKAVTSLVWEIKGLFLALIKGKASDVLADLNIGGGAKITANLVADLSASIPRDVVISAHQQWLPNLAAEIANRPTASDQKQSGWSTTTESSLAGPASLPGQSGSDSRQPNSTLSPPAVDSEAPTPKGAAGKVDTANAQPDEPVSTEKPTDPDTPPATPSLKPEAAATPRANLQDCLVSVFGQCLVTKGAEAKAGRSDLGARPTDSSNPKPRVGEKSPEESKVGLKQVAQATQPEPAAGKGRPAKAISDADKETVSASEQPQRKGADQTDDLLFPTEEELRSLKSGAKDAARADAANGNAPSKADANTPAVTTPAGSDAVAKPQGRTAPVVSIESDVDPENWAEYGGWYRQDYAISYRPIGHKDKFITAWLSLTGPEARRGDKSPATAVFEYLTSKDAQGSCTKCHSVDDMPGQGRAVNFSPPSIESKNGRFTNFIHEPHLGMMENQKRGCLTCHQLEKDRPYLKSFEKGDPQNFVSNFSPVQKDLCQTCHTSTMARQDCLLCHKYHVNGVITPILNTKIPTP